MRFFLHLLLWYLLTFMYVVSLYLNSANSDFSSFIRLDTFALNYGVLGTVNFLLFYALVFYVIPYFLQRKKKVLLAFVILGMILVAGIVKYAIAWPFRGRLLVKIGYIIHPIDVTNVHGTSAATYRPLPANVPSPVSKQLPISQRVLPMPAIQGPFEYSLEVLWLGFMLAFTALTYRILLDWYKNEQIRKALENEKLKAELAFLKMQVNPHFLFNSLNNLYSLSVLEKTSKTAEGIMRLSDMIRYMLYEKEDEQSTVSLPKEVHQLNSYIDLQRLRHDSDMHLHFSIEGDITHSRIAPLLLFPLLENACKHGVVDDAKRPVTIELKVTSSNLLFSIRNVKNHHLKDPTGASDWKTYVSAWPCYILAVIPCISRKAPLIFLWNYNYLYDQTRSGKNAEVSDHRRRAFSH